MENKSNSAYVLPSLKAVKTSVLLEVGTHVTTITDVTPTRPKNDIFKDHMQIAVKCVDKNKKQHTEYLNTRGFDKWADLTQEQKDSGAFEERNGFAVEIATGQRIPNQAKTDQCIARIQNWLADCGLPVKDKKGREIEYQPDALRGQTIGIRLRKTQNGQLEVQATMLSSEVTEVTPETAI